jgi:hypothetical protein
VHVCPFAGAMASTVRRKLLVLKLVPPTVTAKQKLKKGWDELTNGVNKLEHMFQGRFIAKFNACKYSWSLPKG